MSLGYKLIQPTLHDGDFGFIDYLELHVIILFFSISVLQFFWFSLSFSERLQRLISNVEIRIKRGNDRILGHDEQQIEKEKEKKLDAMREEASGILKLAEEAGEAVRLR